MYFLGFLCFLSGVTSRGFPEAAPECICWALTVIYVLSACAAAIVAFQPGCCITHGAYRLLSARKSISLVSLSAAGGSTWAPVLNVIETAFVVATCNCKYFSWQQQLRYNYNYTLTWFLQCENDAHGITLTGVRRYHDQLFFFWTLVLYYTLAPGCIYSHRTVGMSKAVKGQTDRSQSLTNHSHGALLTSSDAKSPFFRLCRVSWTHRNIGASCAMTHFFTTIDFPTTPGRKHAQTEPGTVRHCTRLGGNTKQQFNNFVM